MSGWLDVVNKDGSDEWLEVCNAARIEVQRVTMDRAIRRLTSRKVAADLAPTSYDDDALVTGLREAIRILTEYRNGL